MNRYKNFTVILMLNLLLSLLVIYLSPRFDIFTLLGFLLINFILYAILVKIEMKKEKILDDKINDLFLLLHSLNIDSNNYEIKDDGFGKLRDEIIKIVTENKRIAENAEKNKETLREYTEDIAHQIKTPLTGSLLLLDLLEDDQDNHSQEYIIRLRNNLIRLYNLSEILLKLAALDSGTTEMKKDKVSAKELINEIISSIKDYFIKEDIKISFYGENFYLVCDEKWTYEAIFNVVKNGLEASKDGRVEINIKESNIYKSIFVKDFSEGLDKKRLKKF